MIGSLFRRIPFLLLNPLAAAYLAAVAFDFWHVLRDDLALGWLWPPVLRDLRVWQPEPLVGFPLVPAFFVAGVLALPALRSLLRRVPMTGPFASPGMLAGIGYGVATVYAADLLVGVGTFVLNGPDMSLLDRLASILVLTALGGTLHVLLFAPIIVVGGALLGLANGFYMRPSANTTGR